MKKNISIIVNAVDAEKMKKLVKEATNTAAYYGQLQFVFLVDEQNKECVKMCHELYEKYPPDIFDPFPIPTIKFGLDEEKCIQLADAGIIVYENDPAVFKIKNWDRLLLETYDVYKDNTADDEYWEAMTRLKVRLGLTKIQLKQPA